MGGEDSSRVIIGRQKPTMAGGREGGDAAVAVAPRLAGVGRGGESSRRRVRRCLWPSRVGVVGSVGEERRLSGRGGAEDVSQRGAAGEGRGGGSGRPGRRRGGVPSAACPTLGSGRDEGEAESACRGLFSARQPFGWW